MLWGIIIMIMNRNFKCTIDRKTVTKACSHIILKLSEKERFSANA